MTPLPYTDSSAKVALYVLVVAFALSEISIRVRSSRNRTGTRTDRLSLLAVVVGIYAGTAGGFLAAANLGGAAIAFARWPVCVVGLGAMGAGIVIRQWAVHALGRYFTVDVRVHAAQSVVETGPYRWVAHPSYSGLALTFVGIGLALGNWMSLAACAVLPTAGLIVRIRVEERALREGIGEPYRDFLASRKRLIPGIW